jgi:NAD(P)-dependent dehydrogenase (short-subunit alcohol dehydrogenase family)
VTPTSPADGPKGTIDLAGRVIWVTGSSRGIGAGVARHLARQGATVIVHGRDEATLADVLADVRSTSAGSAVVADARDADALAAAVGSIVAEHGRLDGVVANVGGAAYGAAADLTADRFRRQMDLNLTASFLTAQAARPELAKQRGSIVLVSATATTSATPMFAAYGAAKAGVEHLAASLAAEWGPEVRVNCVSPGLIRTEGSMQAVFRGDEELARRAGRTTAVGRIGEVEDIAWACHFLLSPAAGFVNGATLVVDGGPTEGPTQRILRALEDDR